MQHRLLSVVKIFPQPIINKCGRLVINFLQSQFLGTVSAIPHVFSYIFDPLLDLTIIRDDSRRFHVFAIWSNTPKVCLINLTCSVFVQIFFASVPLLWHTLVPSIGHWFNLLPTHVFITFMDSVSNLLMLTLCTSLPFYSSFNNMHNFPPLIYFIYSGTASGHQGLPAQFLCDADCSCCYGYCFSIHVYYHIQVRVLKLIYIYIDYCWILGM